MVNGTNLDGSSGSTQSAIIVPSPDGTTGDYYVFTIERNNGLKYSVVNMNLAGGLGAVVVGKKNIALVSPTTEKVTAVRHSNNKDVWVITHKTNSDEFYAYLLTDSGVVPTPVVSQVGAVYGAGSQIGYMKASPRGDRLALALGGDQHFDLFDFDNSNGQISNPRSTGNIYNFAYGVEFSPDGSKLYVTSNQGLYQYDLSSALPGKPLGDSIFLGGSPQVAIQLGPNGVIYCNEGYQLGAILNPNEKGLLCNYQSSAVGLSNRFASSGLPTFMQSYFSPIAIAEEGYCFGIPTDFFLIRDRKLDSVRWNFGDPGSGSSNTSTLPDPTHLFTDTGSFSITAYVYTTKCGITQTDTVIKSVEIVDLPVPNAELGEDTVICEGDTIFIDTEGNEPSYIWNTGSRASEIAAWEEGKYWVKASNQCGSLSDTIELIYFESKISANLGVDTGVCEGSVLVYDIRQEGARYLWSTGSTNGQIGITEPGKYWVRVTDLCTSQSDTFLVSEKTRPKVNLGADTIICDGAVLIKNVTYPNSSYRWGDSTTNAQYEITEEGNYRVRVTNQCGSTSDGIYVRLKDCGCTVFTPNAFTPNSDGLNDVLEFNFGCEFAEFEFSVYNRWGELIYRTENPEAFWDGQEGGKPSPTGTYQYQLIYRSINPADPDERIERGMINLIR